MRKAKGQSQGQKQIKRIIKHNYSAHLRKLKIFQEIQYWDKVLLSQSWDSLKVLMLSFCQITDIKINILLEMDWPNLKRLDLTGNLLSCQGVTKLAHKQWPALIDLSLYFNKDGDTGLPQFAIFTKDSIIRCFIKLNNLEWVALFPEIIKIVAFMSF